MSQGSSTWQRGSHNVLAPPTEVPSGGALWPPPLVSSAEERHQGSAGEEFTPRNPLQREKLANDQDGVVRFPIRGGASGAASHLLPSFLPTSISHLLTLFSFSLLLQKEILAITLQDLLDHFKSSTQFNSTLPQLDCTLSYNP